MTNLTDRMRTCAARIVAVASKDDIVYNDAADLLIEASNALEAVSAPLGEPMEIIAPDGKPTMIIPPMSLGEALDRIPPLPYHEGMAAGDTLPRANPYRSANTCPKCDSRANKTVRREGLVLMLICPACGHQWRYQR